MSGFVGELLLLFFLLPAIVMAVKRRVNPPAAATARPASNRSGQMSSVKPSHIFWAGFGFPVLCLDGDITNGSL